MPWTTYGGLLPPSPETLGALALIGRQSRLSLGVLLRLLSGLLLLPSSIDISSMCGIVLLHLLKFFLDGSQFVF
jgi:hypothetical protein